MFSTFLMLLSSPSSSSPDLSTSTHSLMTNCPTSLGPSSLNLLRLRLARVLSIPFRKKTMRQLSSPKGYSAMLENVQLKSA